MYYKLKSIFYAEQSRNRELINRIMDAATQIKNSTDMVERAVRLFLFRTRLCIESTGNYFGQNL